MFENLNEKDKNIANTILENSYGVINEDPTSSGSSYVDQVIVPLINYVQKENIAKELVGVQPIDFKEGKVFGFVLKNDSGEVISGMEAMGTFDENFSDIAEGANLKELVLELNEEKATVKSRKVKLNYTVELGQDLKVLKFNMSEEKTKLVGSEIATAIDFDIVKAIKDHSDYHTPIEYTWDNNKTESYQNPLYELKVAIFNAAGNIASATRKGLANFILVPIKLQGVISSMPGFIADPEPKLGPLSKIGKLGYLNVYINTFDTSSYDMYVGKKPDSEIGAGIIYSPYKIENFSDVPDVSNFSVNEALFARYAITKLKGGNTFYHKVFLTNAPTNFPY